MPEVYRVLARHEERVGPRMLEAVRAAAEETYARTGDGILFAVVEALEDALDRAAREWPTPDHCRFIHRMLLWFGNANTFEKEMAARARMAAALSAHPEYTGNAMPNALRMVVEMRSAGKFDPPPSLLRTLATLGGAAVLHHLRQNARGWLAAGLTRFGEALFLFHGGDRTAVRETALVSCRAGSAMLLPGAPPGQHAKALALVGVALFGRELGDRDTNRRSGVWHLRAALGLLEDDPRLRVARAYTQIRLAGVLHELVAGDHRAHQEEALAALLEALEFLEDKPTAGEHPDMLARARMLLGMILIERIGDDRRENLLAAIQALLAALGTWEEHGKAEEAAVTLNALGLAFVELGVADGMQVGLDAFELSLQTLRHDTHLLEWAIGLSNLGITRLRLAWHLEGTERVEQLNAAIEVLQRAVEALSPSGLRHWAAVAQMNLASSYLARAGENLPGGDPDGDAARALAASAAAEAVFRREGNPREWARTRQVRGLAQLERARHAPAAEPGDHERGLTALAEAVEALPPAAFPHDALEVALALGTSAARLERWDQAVAGHTAAVDAAEQLRRQATAESRRDEIIASARQAYAGLVRASLRAGSPAQALAAAERGKARQLAELLAEQNLKPSPAVPGERMEELGRARATQLAAVRMLTAASMRQELHRAGDDAAGTDPAPLEEHVAAVEAARAAVDAALAAVQAYDPAFALAQAESPPPTPGELAALLPDANTALLSLYLGDEACAFVLTRGGVHAEIAVENEGEELDEALAAYFNAFDRDPENADWWLDDRLGNVFDALGVVTRALAAVPGHVDRLLVVPHRALHLLPLHALEVEGATLIDRFPRGVAYAPSARLLGLAQGRNRRAFDTLLAVRPDASPPLPSTELEVEMVAARFARSRVIEGEQATRSALLEAPETGAALAHAHALHIACHGEFDPEVPLDSALLLAGEERLTMGEVFSLELGTCRLTMLSACGTGRVGLGNTEEYVGLPAGFLYAGSAAVVSSLWSVDDMSTALLSARVYELLHESGDPCAPYAVAEALARAQRWLRDATTAELKAWLAERSPDDAEYWASELWRGSRARRRRSATAEESETDFFDDRPFAETFYWAPFIATGC
ncbi:MAG TPA: CHAT domain-containing protein [Longimicrobium sp.]|nr:CHAT domain-containing protein [Longimicrobium sp.]